MNIEKTLPKIEKKWQKPSKEQTRFDLLYFELAELDKDVSELAELISLRGDGYHIPQSIFDGYGKILQNLDDLSALNIKKSRYEDLVDCFAAMEDVYFELEEIDDKCMKEPAVIIEESDVVDPLDTYADKIITARIINPEEKILYMNRKQCKEPDVVKPVVVEPTEEVIEIKEKKE